MIFILTLKTLVVINLSGLEWAGVLDFNFMF
jgi:hypothetical protein